MGHGAPFVIFWGCAGSAQRRRLRQLRISGAGGRRVPLQQHLDDLVGGSARFPDRRIGPGGQLAIEPAGGAAVDEALMEPIESLRLTDQSQQMNRLPEESG